MPSGTVFHLDVTPDSTAGVVRLRLANEQGRQLGANQVRLADHRAALWRGLFDTRSYVRYYTGVHVAGHPATAKDLLAQLGVFLGRSVLGPDIIAKLAPGVRQRTLLVKMPEVENDRLAAAFARVPWEIARPADGAEALYENNLVVRMESPVPTPADAPPLEGDEPLRVLLVFAEAPGLQPLAMRLEREQLLKLFYDDVMPDRRVAVDVLCHGATRKALRTRVREASGYHIVHWSGHGHQNLLELAGEGGERDRLSGPALVRLFAEAGGFIPHLVFLSACLSGALVGVRDWAALAAVLRDGEAATRKAEPEDLGQALAEQPGYTGTALALLGAGVPQVVAMRYEVGDAYARDLAGLFYRRLLADANPKDPASALAMARRELLDQESNQYHPAYHPVDHATPLLFGGALGPLPVPRGRSAALASRRPQPQPLLPGSHELDRPAELVGRGEPLSHLRECLEEGNPPVVLVQGLAGLGKTALAAEAVHLWHRRFDGVFAFQSKPLALPLDDFLRRLDERLALHSRAYRELGDERPNARIHLPAGAPLSGDARWQAMRDNLLEALRTERLLLVLDNFETHLETVPGKDGYACADPEWDRLLRHLAENLPGSGSRLLVTSRHLPAALAASRNVLRLPLGPLPMAEAVLFLQGNEALSRLARGDEEGRKLALRLLEVSRGHPLILTRLGALAGDRQALAQALEDLETRGLDRLPDVFATRLSDADHEKERIYLEDVAVGAVDLLLHRASPDARRLLWIVTLASEPVTEDLIEAVWATDPPAGPLLEELRGAGLLTKEDAATYGFHELVRERTAARVADHPEEKGGRTEEQAWVAYGERYAAAFQALLRSGEKGSRERAVEAGRRGISYLVRARAFDRLGSFAGGVVISTRDPRLLGQVIAELEGAVEQIPPGQNRWKMRTYLADALDNASRSDEALAFFKQAAAEAEAAEHWSDVGWICQNWAIGLRKVGRLDDAKATFLRSTKAQGRTASPRMKVLLSECEALRIDVMRAEAERALPEIESRLQEVRGWWRRHRAGETVPEAPDAVLLGRALITGLDIAEEANRALERWEACIEFLIEIEETKRELGEGEHEIAGDRFNRCFPLLRLGRLEEAQEVLESCLEIFRAVGDFSAEAATLSALADLWDKRGDRDQAAGLERQALAVFNRLSDLERRSISHGNLANYLNRLGEPEEESRHRLASIVYFLLMGHGQYLAIARRNLGIFMRNAAASGKRYELPRLAGLVARPEFEPLRRTLAERNVGVEALQAEIDRLVAGLG